MAIVQAPDHVGLPIGSTGTRLSIRAKNLLTTFLEAVDRLDDAVAASGKPAHIVGGSFAAAHRSDQSEAKAAQLSFEWSIAADPESGRERRCYTV